MELQTLDDICRELETLDEVTLLELLDLSSEEIVRRFEDVIEIKFEKLQEQLSDEY
tara:strand:+ start:370 stop:537 length:168 start_codon:yes stop_codon:yes gene_type:complete